MLGVIKFTQKGYRMAYFDDKQKKLINSWNNLSEKSEDAYMSFMAKWIAFNAVCYNLYHEKAIIDRPNIDRQKSKTGLNKIHKSLNHSTLVEVEKAQINITSEKWSVDLSLTESRLFISVSNNYTEDIIFSEFEKDNKSWYIKNPCIDFAKLKDSLKKGDHFYIINMAKSKDYRDNDISLSEMIQKNVVKLCEENNLKTLINVLYQIRGNIFHGEKTPGVFNDDRIVKSALPVLKYVVSYLIEKYKINEITL